MISTRIAGEQPRHDLDPQEPAIPPGLVARPPPSSNPSSSGSATVEVEAVQLPPDAAPASATRTIKLGWGRKK